MKLCLSLTNYVQDLFAENYKTHKESNLRSK